MIKYKLTSQADMTRNRTKWGENVTHTTNGEGILCGPGFLHYYHHPKLAVFFNSLHADIKNPKLWECKADGKKLDDSGMKGGCTKLTTIRTIERPKLDLDARKRFMLLVSLAAFGSDKEWAKWVKDYIEGKKPEPLTYESTDNTPGRVRWARAYKERISHHISVIGPTAYDSNGLAGEVCAMIRFCRVYRPWIPFSRILGKLIDVACEPPDYSVWKKFIYSKKPKPARSKGQ